MSLDGDRARELRRFGYGTDAVASILRTTAELSSAIDLRPLLPGGRVLDAVGDRYLVPCPLHLPAAGPVTSMIRRPGAGWLWHCFACGAAGDGVEAVRCLHGVPLVAALRMAAVELGVELALPEPDGGLSAP